MSRVRVRENSASHQAPETAPPPMVPLKPLQVSGFIVTKQALVEALRNFVPGLRDIQTAEDGETFFLLIGNESANAVEISQ